MQIMNVWKTVYLNCKEKYKDMIDHHSCTQRKNSSEIIAWKKFRPEQDSEPWPLQYKCSALPIKLSSQPRAGLVVSS